MSSDFSSSFASASSIMATADLHLRALKCKVLGQITALDFKLKEVQGSITSLEIAMEELGNKLRSSSIVMQSLTQTHQYLDSQHQELVEEMSNMAVIVDNLEANFPFADTADIHVSMLMMH
jgi:chromosome segregation ATPase